ncbi:MAG TPA: AraC family transcriptional regulator [Devosia sp.]|jgi:AraC-like DNA-binding protein|nr:AraC family transcriptional regulator [Devosia sp.]
MKPFLERVRPEDGASWSMLNRRLPDGIPFQWHHHPELELTLTLNSRGQRFIGDSAESFGDHDLVLVGPNLPHTWASAERLDPQAPHVALVLWFRPDWLEGLAAGAVEMRPLLDLVARGARGLHFSAETATALRPAYERLFDLPPTERLFGLLDLLLRLAADGTARPLSASRPALPEGGSRERIDRVLAHLHDHHAEPLRLEALAEVAALSVSGLHRLFRKHTGTTVSDYLIRLRIADASARLSGSDQPVAHIAAEVGYGSLANFNRHFLRLRGMTPRAYRGRFGGVARLA